MQVNRRMMRKWANSLFRNAGLVGLLSLAAAAGGCSSTENRSHTDPLLGAPTVRNPATAHADPLATSNTPAPTGALTSNAALAGGGLQGAKDLRIADSFQKPGTATQPVAQPPISQPHAVAHAEIPAMPTTHTAPPTAHPTAVNPVVPPPVPTTTAHAAARSPNGSRVLNYEEAQAALASRGVNWQRLETWGDKGEWKFSCSIPNKKNAFISRNYEARSPDYLSAIRAVMDQIDREP